MKQNVDKFDYPELNSARDILKALGMPESLCRPRSVMIFASIACVKNGTKLMRITEAPMI